MMPEMNMEEGREYTISENILLKAQLAEYKTSAYFEKSSESLFGFISVLPGAFSTFRWEWIDGKPLNKFLKGATDEFASSDKAISCSTANMYLAEDRIWSLEILARDGNWIIGYVATAIWLTDPPITFASLLKQRRRWYNGSVFASYYILRNFYKVFWCWRKQKRSVWSTISLLVLYFYMLINSAVQHVSIGMMYALFSIIMRTGLSSRTILYYFDIVNWLENSFVICLVLTIFFSWSTRIEWFQKFYWWISIAFGILTVISVVVTFIIAIKNAVHEIAIIIAIWVPIILRAWLVWFYMTEIVK